MFGGVAMRERSSAILTVGLVAALAYACTGGDALGSPTVEPTREPPSGGRENPGTTVDNPGPAGEDPGSTRDDPGAGESNGSAGASGVGCLPCDTTISCDGTPVLTLISQGTVCMAASVGGQAQVLFPVSVAGCVGTITSMGETATITQESDGTVQLCAPVTGGSGGSGTTTECISCSAGEGAGDAGQPTPIQVQGSGGGAGAGDAG
jgi:hypothetical protein